MCIFWSTSTWLTKFTNLTNYFTNRSNTHISSNDTWYQIYRIKTFVLFHKPTLGIHLNTYDNLQYEDPHSNTRLLI